MPSMLSGKIIKDITEWEGTRSLWPFRRFDLGMRCLVCEEPGSWSEKEILYLFYDAIKRSRTKGSFSHKKVGKQKDL